MKEINEITQERIADAVLSAMKWEGLMNREVAEILNVTPADMSYIKRHKKKVSQPVWAKLRAWMISGVPLREYKPSAEPIPAPQDNVSATSNVNVPPVVEKPVEAKDETAERIRETYEMSRGKEIKVPRRKPEDIDPASGELLASITIDINRDYFLIKLKR